MSGYNDVEQENIIEKIKPYIKKGENVKISEPLKYKNKLYRKVIFNKGVIGAIRGKEDEFLFVDEVGNVLSKDSIQKELIKLSYYQDIFFDETNKISIFKAIQDEAQMIKDENDYKDVEVGLMVLKREIKNKGEFKELKEKGIDEILEVIKKVPELRKNNNDKLKEISKMVKGMKEQQVIFSEEILDEIYPVYKEALLFNFKKVKIIAKGQEHYYILKKSAEKIRRKFSLTLRRKYIGNLIKTNYVMGYFYKVIHTYRKVLDMNERDYLKFLKDLENDNVQNKMKLIRDNK